VAYLRKLVQRMARAELGWTAADRDVLAAIAAVLWYV
jgi:hypothetical protein